MSGEIILGRDKLEQMCEATTFARFRVDIRIAQLFAKGILRRGDPVIIEGNDEPLPGRIVDFTLNDDDTEADIVMECSREIGLKLTQPFISLRAEEMVCPAE